MIQLGVALATALEFAGLSLSPQAEQAKVGEPKKLESQNNDAVVTDLIKRASASVSTSSPRAVAPGVLLGIGQAVDGCSSSTALDFIMRAFEGARALRDESPKDEGSERGLKTDESLNREIRATKRRTFVGVVAWLSSSSNRLGRPDLLALAQDLAGQIDYGTGIVKRQEVYGPIFSVLIGKKDYQAIRQLLSQVEKGDGVFPYRLAREVVQADRNSELTAEVVQSGYRALAAGQGASEGDLRFAEATLDMVPRAVVVEALKRFVRYKRNEDLHDQATQALIRKAVQILLRLAPQLASEYAMEPQPAEKQPSKKQEDDPLVLAYEKLLVVAEESSSAVAQVIMSVQDPRAQQALLTSSIASLRRQGKYEAADRVAEILATIAPQASLQQHPAEFLTRARSSATGEELGASIRQALSIAESVLAEDSKRYEASVNEVERLRVYKTSSQESVATYVFASENALDLAAESASRIFGPQQADVIIGVLATACEKKEAQDVKAKGPREEPEWNVDGSTSSTLLEKKKPTRREVKQPPE